MHALKLDAKINMMINNKQWIWRTGQIGKLVHKYDPLDHTKKDDEEA